MTARDRRSFSYLKLFPPGPLILSIPDKLKNISLRALLKTEKSFLVLFPAPQPFQLSVEQSGAERSLGRHCWVQSPRSSKKPDLEGDQLISDKEPAGDDNFFVPDQIFQSLAGRDQSQRLNRLLEPPKPVFPGPCQYQCQPVSSRSSFRTHPDNID